MNDPAPIDVALQRRRLILMLAINGLCAVVALAAAFGFLRFHQAWMGGLFVVAMLAGFGAHLWLVLGLKRKT